MTPRLSVVVQRVGVWTADARAVSQTLDDRVVTSTPSAGGCVDLRESPVRMTAAVAVAEGNLLVVRGSQWGDVGFRWRRYIAQSDDLLDVACRRPSSSEDGWAADVEVDALIPATTVKTSVDPLASPADWILFATRPDEGTDRRFLFKHLDELREHRRVAANRLSTAIFYGVGAGREPAVYGDRMEVDGENPIFGGQGRIEWAWPEMLGKTVDLEAARATTDQELGKPWTMPPAELRMLFDWRERV